MTCVLLEIDAVIILMAIADDRFCIFKINTEIFSENFLRKQVESAEALRASIPRIQSDS